MLPKYASHVPLSTPQKLAVALLSGVGSALDPRRADLVAAFGELTGTGVWENILKRMQASPEGRRILKERPRIS